MSSLKKELAQYYTSSSLGDEVVSMLSFDSRNRNILDLSAGEGALLLCAERASKNLKVYGIDIDENNIFRLKRNRQDYVLYCGDSTREETINRLTYECSEFDFVIGNPPFKSISLTDELKSGINSSFLANANKKIRSEIVFLYKGLSLLAKGGVLAYILPDGIITNSIFSPLRDYLSENYKIIEIREVAEGAFDGTEAKTHIIIIENNKPFSTDMITLSCFKTKAKKEITTKQFVHRGDFNFYNIPALLNYKTFKELKVELIRGRGTKSQENKDFFLHTTSFKEDYNEFIGSEYCLSSLSNRLKIAKEGDILIPRVGTRCVGKVGYLLKGELFISDCLIIIRVVSSELRLKIIQNLTSDFGVDWIKRNSKGVGAKHITLADLENYPVI